MEMKEGQFALIRGWAGQIEAVEIAKVTPKLFKTKRAAWGGRQYKRIDAVAVFSNKERADHVAQALNGARGEMLSRVRKAQADFDDRRASARAAYDKSEQRILAQAIEAPPGGETTSGSTEGESAVPKGCAQ